MTDFSGFIATVPNKEELRDNALYWEGYAEGTKDALFIPSPAGARDYAGYRVRVDALLKPTTVTADQTNVIGQNPDGSDITVITTKTIVDSEAVGFNAGVVDLANYVWVHDTESPHNVAS